MPRKATQVIQPAGMNLTSSSAMSGSKNPLISRSKSLLNCLPTATPWPLSAKINNVLFRTQHMLELGDQLRRVRRLGFAHHQQTAFEFAHHPSVLIAVQIQELAEVHRNHRSRDFAQPILK